ncbi:MAG: hypothetical protein J6Q51_00255 [Clostridia bacterium]|nr:hypothetical protein [Clostridia bacterium]
MWEFCITVEKDKYCIKNYIHKQLTMYVQNFGGVVTILEKDNFVDILVACNKFEKHRLILFLQETISEVICYYYKKDFLSEYLHINIGDKITKQAFIYSLLFFDKETDKYIVCKYLNIENRINISGLYNFKLRTLKDKWKELIEIANENEIYLYSDETFMELIKFLIDNIEVKSDVINIMSTEDSYAVFDSNFDKINNENVDLNIEENILAQLITMCPKIINIYCSELLPNRLKTLICKLFEKRVKFISKIN